MKFDEILSQGIRQGQIPARTQHARKWYRDLAGNINRPQLPNEPDRNKSKVAIGDMYMFHYDPKHKETLPHYDTFPVIFPIQPAEDGFIGLNLHYLHPKMRARLMDELYKYKTNDNFDPTTKIQASYSILKTASKSKLVEPCLKRYLSAHVRSPFLYVYPSEWDVAAFLPVQDFRKQTAKQVWNQKKRVK
jgi:hypothetical protein